jgi:hypothetical protein
VGVESQSEFVMRLRHRARNGFVRTVLREHRKRAENALMLHCKKSGRLPLA